MTGAYWREFEEMNIFVDIPSFTRQLYEGYQYYVEILRNSLLKAQQPRIASVILFIWEENPSFWQDKLFSIPIIIIPHLMGPFWQPVFHLPPTWMRFTDPVFERARLMQLDSDPLQLPTEDEAIYLRDGG
jgi:hypothetical protein